MTQSASHMYGHYLAGICSDARAACDVPPSQVCLLLLDIAAYLPILCHWNFRLPLAEHDIGAAYWSRATICPPSTAAPHMRCACRVRRRLGLRIKQGVLRAVRLCGFVPTSCACIHAPVVATKHAGTTESTSSCVSSVCSDKVCRRRGLGAVRSRSRLRCRTVRPLTIPVKLENLGHHR